ncbi:MAG: IclR family transcriptional regulator [Marmoricola sp.]|nr:IclR family transcriptional regulator [Marmoricola sp.]
MPEHDPASENETSASKNRSSSLRRALDLVDYVADARMAPGGVTLTELATGVGLSKSTAYRLLAPLIDYGLVNRTASGGYEVGLRAVHLGQVYLERSDVRTVAAGLLSELREQTGETSHLVVPDRFEVVYIAKSDNPGPTTMSSRVGTRQPLHCTAVGKAVLADMSDDAIDEVVAMGLPPRTPQTRTTRTALLADLEIVRSRGFAVDDGENEVGIRCIGAAIKDGTASVVAAISVSGPDGRVTRDRVDEIGSKVTAIAIEISRRLGYREASS